MANNPGDDVSHDLGEGLNLDRLGERSQFPVEPWWQRNQYVTTDISHDLGNESLVARPDDEAIGYAE